MSIRLLGALILIACATLPAASAGDRIAVTLDTSEAGQVLAILALRNQGQPVPDAEWQRLFDTVPYQRLKQREGVAFSDDDFMRFVLSAGLARRAAALSSTIERWKEAQLQPLAGRVLAYLPAGATIRATVCPVIKPESNSFVADPSSDPAIFLYLEPGMRREKFENNVAHEFHHIGLASLGPIYSRKIAALPPPAQLAARWMSAFGEGVAVLAAAGGPDGDPHASSSAKERARWAQNIGEFNNDLPAVNRFFLDVLEGAPANRGALQEKGRSFYGPQGPWYTLGYKMSAMVERSFGRQALVDTMLDPRCLLVLYNRAAAAESAGLPLWSPDVLSAVQAGTCAQP